MQIIKETYIPEFMEVLSDTGWIELSKYNQKNPVLVLNQKFKHAYLQPKQLTQYFYKGNLIQIITDSHITYIKPSVFVVTNETVCKAKDVKKGDLLNKFNMWSKVERVEVGEWSGILRSLFFGEPLFLPVKFENDYCLLLV